jgi:magnesium chelatase family protein
MDRIDLYAEVQEIEHERLLSPVKNSDDESIRERVSRARNLQAVRYDSPTKLNADMTNNDIKTKSKITPEAQNILNEAAKTLGLSARSYMRVIKVARTIADLDAEPNIAAQHIAEALQYRSQNLNTLT